MQDVTLIGIDLGKHSFHVHGQDRHGKALLRKKSSKLRASIGCSDGGAGGLVVAILGRPQGFRF